MDELAVKVMKGENLPKEEKLKILALCKLDHLVDELEDCLYSSSLNKDDIKKSIELLQKIAKVSTEYQKYLPSNLKYLPTITEKLINEFIYLYHSQNNSIRREELKPQLDKIDKIMNDINSLEIEEGLYRYLLALGGGMRDIRNFLKAPPENKFRDIIHHIRVEAHETAHAILDNYFLKKLGKDEREKFYSLKELRALDEGFADAFSLYFITKQIEKGYLPFDAIKQAAEHEKETLGERDKIFMSYTIGGFIFGLDKITKEVENIDTSRLSPSEIKERARDIRKKLSKRIEYIIGIIKNPSIPFDKKIQIFLEMEKENAKKLYENKF
jgi:hypothetical protein